jgi:hypothetical protein
VCSHEQEPVYFTIEPIDHQQVPGFELNQTSLSDTAGVSNTIIESTYDVISGCHMTLYENVDTANAENVDTLAKSEINSIVSLPYCNCSAVMDKKNQVSDNETEEDDENYYGQEDAYGFPVELSNYVPNKCE